MNFLLWTPSPQNLGFVVVHQNWKEAWKLVSIASMFLVASIVVSSVKRCAWYQRLFLTRDLFLIEYHVLEVARFCWGGSLVSGLLAFSSFLGGNFMPTRNSYWWHRTLSFAQLGGSQWFSGAATATRCKKNLHCSYCEVNDGTRMLSDKKGLWELFQAFKWVLKEASIDFDLFTAKKDDAQDLIDFLLG